MVLASVFWGVVWRDMDRSVMTRAPILDEAHYLRTAHALAHDDLIPDEPFYMSPLYAYLVAATGSGRELDENRLRLGSPPSGIRILQAVLWLGVAWLLLRVGRSLLGPRWGWAPPIFWLLYRPAAILAGQVLLEIPLAFAATAALAVAGGFVGPADRRRRALLAGAAVGAAVLLRGTSLVLLVPVVWSLLRPADRDGPAPRRGIAALVLAAALVIVLPAALHNSYHAGRVAGPTLNGGVNLFIGMGSEANGLFRAFEGFDVERDPSGVAYLSGKTGRAIAGPAEADRVWFEETRDDVSADPGRALGLWVRKVRLFLCGAEFPQISPLTAWTEAVPAFRLLIIPFGLLSALALAGAALGWRAHPGLRPWLLAVALLVAVQAVFFVVTRYRIVFVPALALAAGAALAAMGRAWSAQAGRSVALGRAGAVTLLAAAAVMPWGLSDTLDHLETAGLDNVAVRWEHAADADAERDPAAARDELVRAEDLYRRSIDRDRTRVQPWRGLARVVWKQRGVAASTAVAVEGLGEVLHPSGLRFDLIGLLLAAGRGVEAVPYMEAALRDDPDDAEMLHNLAVALAGAGRADAAAAAAQRLLTVAPDDPRGYVDLGVILARAGRLAEAREVLAAGLARHPGHRNLAANLAQVDEQLAGDGP